MYVYILGFSIPRTSSARNMHHGAQSSVQGHAVWTASVSATCSLYLTVPLLVDAYVVWLRKGNKLNFSYTVLGSILLVLSPRIGVACRWGYFPITWDAILDSSSA